MLARPIPVAVAAALAAALLATLYLSLREEELLHMVEPVSVVMATRTIATGMAVDEAFVNVVQVPRRYREPNALTTLRQLEGLVAVVSIPAGSQITTSLARIPSSTLGLTSFIPPGKRAVVLALPSAAAAGGMVRPGDAVDVLATFDLGTETSIRRTTLTFLSDVLILAVQGKLMGSPERNPEASPKSSNLFAGSAASLGKEVIEVAVAVSVEQAQALAYAQESGSVSLALRAGGTVEEVVQPAPTTMATIVGGNEELLPLKRSYREYRGRR